MNKNNKFSRVFLMPEGGGGGGGESNPEGTGLFGGGIQIGGVSTALLEAPITDIDPNKKETPLEEKLPVEKVVDPVKPVVKKLGHERFAELEESRNKAQKEFDDAKADWEKQKADWAAEKEALSKPVIPDEFKKEFDSIKAKNEQMEKDFKAAIIQREIQQKFTPERNGLIEKLKTIADAADDGEIKGAIARWDYDAMAVFAEGLSPSQKRDWNRALDRVEIINEEVSKANENIEGSWEEMQKQSALAISNSQRDRVQKHVTMAEGIFGQMLEAIPAIKDAPELSKLIKSDMIAMAGGDGNERFPAERVLRIVAEHPVLSQIVGQQKTKIEELSKALAEREETIKQLKPNFGNDHIEEETEEGTTGTGLFRGGIVVNRR